jgi:hypothetical protein
VLNHVRFSVRQLFLWLSVYALQFAVISGLPLVPLQVAASITVLTAFVAIDSMSERHRSTAPAMHHCAMVVAIYATAFAVSVAVCFALLLILPAPPTPPRPQVSFLTAVYQVVSGQLVIEAIEKAITIQFAHYRLFSLLSMIAFFASVFALRRFRSAKWYAIVNVPGMCLFMLFAFETIRDLVDR